MPVDHFTQPGNLFIERRFGALAALLLIAPVRGNAVFAHAVHFLGANLHFERPTSRTDNRSVQALVHVELRHGDVVFEAPRHWMPQTVNRAQRRIAVFHRSGDDAHGDKVVDLGKAFALLRHLLIDGIQVLWASHDLRPHADLVHFAMENGNDLFQILLAFTARFGNHARNLFELSGLQIEER